MNQLFNIVTHRISFGQHESNGGFRLKQLFGHKSTLAVSKYLSPNFGNFQNKESGNK